MNIRPSNYRRWLRHCNLETILYSGHFFLYTLYNGVMTSRNLYMTLCHSGKFNTALRTPMLGLIDFTAPLALEKNNKCSLT